MKERLGPEQWAVIRLALVAVFGEAGYAVVNALALPIFVSKTLHATLSLGVPGGYRSVGLLCYPLHSLCRRRGQSL